MKVAQLFLISMASLLLAACWPREHPDRMDFLEVRAEGGEICFGSNGYRENLEKYNVVSISVSKRLLATNQFVHVVSEEFISKDIPLNDCFSPFKLSVFEPNTEYAASLAYRDGYRVMWRFSGQFCLPKPKNEPLEVLQLSYRHDVKQVCNIPNA